MLLPKRVKHRKQQRGRMAGAAKGGTSVEFGQYGLKALEPGWITNRQIEAARIAMTRKIKRGGKVWINIFPDKPYTKKPAETRMGSGKGNPEGWVAVVKPGKVMFELAGVREPGARSDAAGGAQASDQVQVRDEGGRSFRGLRSSDELSETTSWSCGSATRARSCSTCASSTRRDSSTTRNSLLTRREIARLLTLHG